MNLVRRSSQNRRGNEMRNECRWWGQQSETWHRRGHSRYYSFDGFKLFCLTLDRGSSALNHDPSLSFWKNSGGGCSEREVCVFVGGGSVGAVVVGRGASLGSYYSACSSGSTISSWQRWGDTCPRWVLVKKVSLFMLVAVEAMMVNSASSFNLLFFLMQDSRKRLLSSSYCRCGGFFLYRHQKSL